MPKTLYRPEMDILRDMLLEARLAAGMTQADVANALGFPQERISAIERGIRRVDVLELRDLCSVMGEDFIGFMKRFDAAAAAVGEMLGRVKKPTGVPRRRRK